ncbi:MAG: heparinase II/III family protein [Sulfuricella sp.]|nr:heparinase II/III family protein [Sulfuricella sp.]
MNIRYTLAAYLTAALVLLSIWLPEAAHYHVATPSIAPAVIDRSRALPPIPVMRELAALNLGVEVDLSAPELTRTADKITDGLLQLPGYAPVAIGIPFDPSDLDKGLPTWRLQFASLAAPEILLDAYAVSGNEVYFTLARDMILAWIKYEKRQWLPRGFLWNDHAIAARVTVLAKFWGACRARGDFSPEVAASVLEAVSRSGEMLAKEGHFTFATNHGIMQNLALLHIATAFPALPAAQRFRQIAFDRLRDQMAFFLDDEGIVLEHSAGYHSHGMVLLGKALRYLTLNDMAPPPSWLSKYEKGKEFMAMIHRPDGSLPIYGNTNGGRRPDTPVTDIDSQGRASALHPAKEWHPAAAHALYPVAGYSVWWDNLASAGPPGQTQTVMAWSYYPGHGHKLADEMSLLLWSGNQTWLTNTGYWPYGVWGRDETYSWEGSNAPHLAGEPRNSARRTELLGYAAQEGLAASHLRRTGPDGYSAERQVVHLGSDLWLVLDRALDGIPRKTTTTWTFYPDLDLSRGALADEFRLSRRQRDACMATFVLGSKGTEISTLKGSKTPFAGWVVVGSQPVPAPSLLVEQPSGGSWAVTLLALEQDCRERFAAPPKVLAGNGADGWKVSLPLKNGAVEVERTGATVLVTDGSGKTGDRQITLRPAPDLTAERRAIDGSFQSAAMKYKKYPELFEYRSRLSYLLLGVFLFQEAAVAVCIGRARTYRIPLRMLGIAAWIVGGSLIYLVYLKV